LRADEENRPERGKRQTAPLLPQELALVGGAVQEVENRQDRRQARGNVDRGTIANGKPDEQILDRSAVLERSQQKVEQYQARKESADVNVAGPAMTI